MELMSNSKLMEYASTMMTGGEEGLKEKLADDPDTVALLEKLQSIMASHMEL